MISPKISMYLNILALAFSVFALAGWWTDMVGNHMAAIIQGVMTTTYSAINIVLHAYSSEKAGPAVTK